MNALDKRIWAAAVVKMSEYGITALRPAAGGKCWYLLLFDAAYGNTPVIVSYYPGTRFKFAEERCVVVALDSGAVLFRLEPEDLGLDKASRRAVRPIRIKVRVDLLGGHHA